MIDLVKEMWFKWRTRVHFAEVQKGPEKRRKLREAQATHKAKYESAHKNYKNASKL